MWSKPYTGEVSAEAEAALSREAKTKQTNCSVPKVCHTLRYRARVEC